MSDNPKSLASLAGKLNAKPSYQGLEMTQAEVRRTKEAMMAAAAALRAPTIAAAERCESCRKVLARGWKYDSTGDVKLCLACYTALSTPSPTMTDRLRETDALPFSEPELKGWQMGADSGATATNHNVRRFLATIESQGNALRAVEALCFQNEQMMAGGRTRVRGATNNFRNPRSPGSRNRRYEQHTSQRRGEGHCQD